MYGRVELAGSNWCIVTEPQVSLRMKRVFQRMDKGQFGKLYLSDTIENARELEWFLERYPMDVHPREYLSQRSQQHKSLAVTIHHILTGHYEPTQFQLALPPREYQRVAADMALATGSLLLADDVGLGKTLSAICTFCDSRTLPALVVCMSHLTWQWRDEIKKFAPDLRTHVIRTGKVYDIARTREMKGQLPDVYIINYHKLRGWADTLAPIIKSVVYNEVQDLRTGEGLKYAAAKHISDNVAFRTALSATPFYNYGGEFYNVAEIVRPSALGTREEFIREWCTYGEQKPRVKDPRAFGVYLRETGLMLRRTRKEVGRELPPVIRVPHTIEADTAELERIKSSATELARIILSQGQQARGEKFLAAEEFSNLVRQATGIAKASYVAEFVRLLVESGERVVLFGWHRTVYDIWLDRLRDFMPAIYTGSESPQKKHAEAKRFMDGATPILIMSLRSGAGIDGLQHTSKVTVFGELDWSPGVHDQCIGRQARDGQDETVLAYYLVSETGSDPVVMDVLGLKRQQIEGVKNPDQDLIEMLDSGGADNVKRLAQEYLTRHGA